MQVMGPTLIEWKDRPWAMRGMILCAPLARRYQFALSQVLTTTLWPAVFPQRTYRVQYRCRPCRARSGRPEGTIISAEFVPGVLSRRDASRVRRPCDADSIELYAQLFPLPTYG